MKKLLLFILCLWSLAAYAQVGSQSVSGIKFRVNDTTTYQAAAVSAHTAGYADIYWNNQATTKHFDAWNGSSYTHIFDFTGGSGIDGSTALNSYAVSHTLDAGDVNDFNDNGIIQFTGSGPYNLTVPLNATVGFDIPTQIGVCNWSSDTVTVVWTGGVTGNDGGYVEIYPGGAALLIKVDINEWNLQGTQPGGGGAGDLTITSFVFSEVPSGTVNGSNAAFTLANTPTSGTLQVYLNGLRQKAGGVDYTLSGTTITFVTAPETGDILLADYLKP